MNCVYALPFAPCALLSAALLGSFGGGIISVIILVFLAPLLAHVAANFGPPE